MSQKTVTDILGVYANGIHCGIKERKKDLAFIYIPEAMASAGVFTKNQFVAPSVTYTKKCLKKNTLKAMIINSGNANAGTGEIGEKNNKTMAKLTEELLGLEPFQVGVSSTGIIGKQMPMDIVEKGIKTILKNPKATNADAAAEAILTTDLTLKQVFVEEKIGNKKIVVAGFAKGSGMLAPNMATMLAYLVTNAHIPGKELQTFLQEAVDESFNMLSVDNDTSTNDMVLLFATGDKKFCLTSKEERTGFVNLLKKACIELTRMMADDGEGATHLIEVEVLGAAKKSEAKKVALNIVNSLLVKTAIAGADPNWGRILAATGKDPEIKINTKKIDLYLQNILIYAEDKIQKFDRDKLIKKLKEKEVKIKVDLNLGSGRAMAWSCDLTKGYIDINTKYS